METDHIALQKKIMRRIYGVFALRLATHPITLQVGVFSIALLVLAKLVHVSRVIENMLSTSVGNLPKYLWHTFSHAFLDGEVLTLIAVGVIIFSLLSIPRSLYRTFVPKRYPEAVWQS